MVVVADALTVSFLPLSSTMPHGVSRFCWFPTRLKILYCNPRLRTVIYKLLFALILKLYGTICHTILKTWEPHLKFSTYPMGPGVWKWHQTDRDVISYHYHSKLVEVLAIPSRRVFKKKNSGSTLTCTISHCSSTVHFFSTILSGTGAHGECATFGVWVEAFGAELLGSK